MLGVRKLARQYAVPAIITAAAFLVCFVCVSRGPMPQRRRVTHTFYFLGDRIVVHVEPDGTYIGDQLVTVDRIARVTKDLKNEYGVDYALIYGAKDARFKD